MKPKKILKKRKKEKIYDESLIDESNFMSKKYFNAKTKSVR